MDWTGSKDFSETPYAEDFHMEIMNIIDYYKTMKRVDKIAVLRMVTDSLEKKKK